MQQPNTALLAQATAHAKQPATGMTSKATEDAAASAKDIAHKVVTTHAKAVAHAAAVVGSCIHDGNNTCSSSCKAQLQT